MHYQRAPHTEAKLVRCTRGAIRDVIVDMRRSSATFLQHQGFELTSENRHQLYVPPGFAHGFQTLSDDAEVTYLVSAAYTPEAEGGVHCTDPRLSIEWRSEEHTSELQSLMRISYAVFCLKKKKQSNKVHKNQHTNQETPA